MDDLLAVAPHWGWLIAAVLLATAELVAPGFFLVWLAGAALLTGIATLALGIGFSAQVVLFAVTAVAAVYAVRRWFRANPIATSHPLLNERTAYLIGEQVMVVEPISGGEGRVRVGDGVWSARGPDAAAGAWVRIVGADGSVLRTGPL